MELENNEIVDIIQDGMAGIENAMRGFWESENSESLIPDLVSAANWLAIAITPRDAAAGHDASGGTVASLTEAVMGVTAGLFRVAEAIENAAQTIADSRQ